MTDETKHKLAKELYFFFKWLLIAGLLASILYLLITIEESTDFCHGVYLDIIQPYLHPIIIGVIYFIVLLIVFSPIIVFVGAYLFRLYKWVMKWK